MRILQSLSLLVVWSFTASPAQASLLNGDFETGDLSGWLSSGGVTIGSSFFVPGGDYEARLFSSDDSVAQLSQGFSLAGPGLLEFEYDAGAELGDGSSVVFALTNVDSSATVILSLLGPGVAELFDPPFFTPSISYFVSAPGNYVFTVSVTGADGAGYSYAALDNVTLTVVPEASALLLGICGTGLIPVVARRKQVLR